MDNLFATNATSTLVRPNGELVAGPLPYPLAARWDAGVRRRMLTDDEVARKLRTITRLVCRLTRDGAAFGLGCTYGYGFTFENEVFAMHPYCWCERVSCPWCVGDAPNFVHKATGATIHWYKCIGCGMRASEADWRTIFREVVASLTHRHADRAPWVQERREERRAWQREHGLVARKIRAARWAGAFNREVHDPHD